MWKNHIHSDHTVVSNSANALSQKVNQVFLFTFYFFKLPK